MKFVVLCVIVSMWNIRAFFTKSNPMKSNRVFSSQIPEPIEMPMDDGEVSWDTDADIRLRRLREYLRLNNITYQSIIEDGKKTFWDNPHNVPFLFV